MQAHLVTFGDHAAHQLGLGACVFDEHEERGMRMPAGEYIQYAGGPLRVRTVIESQCHQRLVCPDTSDRPQTGTDKRIGSALCHPPGTLLGTAWLVHRDQRGGVGEVSYRPPVRCSVARPARLVACGPSEQSGDARRKRNKLLIHVDTPS